MNNDTDQIAFYLKATQTIDSDHETIHTLAEELCAAHDEERGKARALFYFVRDTIHYNAYMVSTFREDFIASTVLAWKRGYCVQKAVLLAALARASGIPSRLVFAKIRNHKASAELAAQTGLNNIFPRHGYAQLMIEGRWISVAPTFDSKLCETIAAPVVEFDGIHDAILSPRDLAGNPYIEYLEHYGSHADLPFEWIRDKVVLIWGEKHSWLTSEEAKGHVMPTGYVFA